MPVCDGVFVYVWAKKKSVWHSYVLTPNFVDRNLMSNIPFQIGIGIEHTQFNPFKMERRYRWLEFITSQKGTNFLHTLEKVNVDNGDWDWTHPTHSMSQSNLFKTERR